jgi:hypothetical protein
MKSLYFWNTMQKDVANVLKSCKKCSLFNEKRKESCNYPLLIGKAFEKVGIDLIGPLKETKMVINTLCCNRLFDEDN